jgi:Ca2+-binding EF-hand superfamily protein
VQTEVSETGQAHAGHDKSPTRKNQLVSKVLQQLIPLQIAEAGHPEVGVYSEAASCPQQMARRESTTSEIPNSVPAGDDTDVASEVAAFRSVLSKSFGNLTRAFRAMKNAANLHSDAVSNSYPVRGQQKSVPGRLPSAASRLNCYEFEWCVSAYLHYGDRRLARRLFVALDQEGRGDIGILELAQQPCRRSLLSLVELRRLLLDRHASLARAFCELEEYLEKSHAKGDGQSYNRQDNRHKGRSGRTVQLPEFIEAVACFGLDAHQASHFFSIMDVDGDRTLTLAEFLDALTHMPRDVLLHDLRQRLLLQYKSMSHAFRELIAADSHSSDMDCKSFSSALSRLGILDVEAAEIFKIVDGDGSGDVSIGEFRDVMREIAPTIRIESFWQRFAAEWPEIRVAASLGGALAQQTVGALVLELLPHELSDKYGMDASPRRGGTLARTSHAANKFAAAPPAQTLRVITFEVFDALSALLDVSRANAQELFAQILAAVSFQRRPAASRLSETCESAFDAEMRVELSEGAEQEVHMEDFLEQLQFWIENPLEIRLDAKSDDRARGIECGVVTKAPAQISGVLEQVLAPSKATIAALKAELAPPKPEPTRPSEKASSRRSSRRKKLPKLPWQPFTVAPASVIPICS